MHLQARRSINGKATTRRKRTDRRLNGAIFYTDRGGLCGAARPRFLVEGADEDETDLIGSRAGSRIATGIARVQAQSGARLRQHFRGFAMTEAEGISVSVVTSRLSLAKRVAYVFSRRDFWASFRGLSSLSIPVLLSKPRLVTALTDPHLEDDYRTSAGQMPLQPSSELLRNHRSAQEGKSYAGWGDPYANDTKPHPSHWLDASD